MEQKDLKRYNDLKHDLTILIKIFELLKSAHSLSFDYLIESTEYDLIFDDLADEFLELADRLKQTKTIVVHGKSFELYATDDEGFKYRKI